MYGSDIFLQNRQDKLLNLIVSSYQVFKQSKFLPNIQHLIDSKYILGSSLNSFVIDIITFRVCIRSKNQQQD
jgi:hypothetical protein